jgi:Kef-type K+ transport system membrane component KefB
MRRLLISVAAVLVLAPAVDGAIGPLAFLGLLFLLVLAGLELDVGLITDRLRAVGIVALAGIVLPFGLGVGVGFLLPEALLVPSGDRLVFSLFLATALSISAIPVIARVLRGLGVCRRPFGQVIVAAAMLTDAIGWVVLSLVTGLARTGRLDGVAVATTLVSLGAFLVVAFTAGQRAVGAILDRLDDHAGSPSQVSLLLLVSLSTAALLLWVGLEPALGAFVVGVVFARADALSESALETFESMTLGFFAPLFFAVAGLRADLGLLADPSVLAVGVGLIVVASVGKFLGAYLGAALTGSPRWEAIGVGIALNARGAIEIVIAALGLEFGILSAEMYTVILVVALVTTVLSPPLLRRSIRKASRGPA